MLVLAPAACIMSGIALSEAFGVFTRSVKFQLSALLESPGVSPKVFLSHLHACNCLLTLLFSFQTNIPGYLLNLRQGIPLLEMLHLKMMYRRMINSPPVINLKTV